MTIASVPKQQQGGGVRHVEHIQTQENSRKEHLFCLKHPLAYSPLIKALLRQIDPFSGRKDPPTKTSHILPRASVEAILLEYNKAFQGCPRKYLLGFVKTNIWDFY